MRMDSLGREPSHTSALRCLDRHPHPKYELRGSNGREPNRDRKVFHHHGVYPAKFLRVNPESVEEGRKKERKKERILT